MAIVLNKKGIVKQAAPTIRLAVDFPRQNEVVSGPDYAVRITAPEGVKSVEVCLDQGEWRSCRPAVGYWWYDWSGYGEGEHEVIARVETQEGRRIASEQHEFFVDLQLKPRK